MDIKDSTQSTTLAQPTELLKRQKSRKKGKTKSSSSLTLVSVVACMILALAYYFLGYSYTSAPSISDSKAILSADKQIPSSLIEDADTNVATMISTAEFVSDIEDHDSVDIIVDVWEREDQASTRDIEEAILDIEVTMSDEIADLASQIEENRVLPEAEILQIEDQFFNPPPSEIIVFSTGLNTRQSRIPVLDVYQHCHLPLVWMFKPLCMDYIESATSIHNTIHEIIHGMLQ
jgi:hypothetical protein